MEVWMRDLEGPKMKGHLEALLELRFCTKPSNFGVDAHMEALAGVALSKQ
jgi:hypothetical protein